MAIWIPETRITSKKNLAGIRYISILYLLGFIYYKRRKS
nr:MAG TPA: hypothetical protein [Caudoviricetes sp.]